MTYDEVMAAARRADAAGEASDARRLLEIASLLPDRPQRGANQTAPASGQTPSPMNVYEVEADGQIYEIDAPVEAAVGRAVQDIRAGTAAMPSATPQSTPDMVEAELFDGTILEFPQGTDPAVIDRAARQETQTRRQPSPGIRVEPSSAAPAQGQAAGPWDKYAPPAPAASGPWDKYAPQFGAQAAPQAASGLVEVEIPDGRILEFPAGTSQDVMRGAIQELLAKEGPAKPALVDAATGQALPMPTTPPAYYDGSVAQAAPQAAALPQANTPAEDADFWSWAGDLATDVAGSTARGLRKGVSNIVGAPVELVNASPMLGNLLPGEQGMAPMSDNPVGGAQWVDELMRGGLEGVSEPIVPDYQPQTTAGRFASRVGEEVGAAAVPVAGAMGKAASLTADAARTAVPAIDAARRMNPIARTFVEPMLANRGRTLRREGAFAAAAGTGAQAANEMVTPDGEGTWWSDVLGSIGGMTALGTTKAIGGLGKHVGGAVRGDPAMMEDVAGQIVSSRIIDNSSEMQSAYAQGGRMAVNPEQLARRLENPSRAELAFPGYKADIADRAQDPGISVLAYNTNTVLPGSAAARRNSNAEVVDDWFTASAPEGNASELRAALGRGAQQRIGAATDEAAGVSRAFDSALSDITPQRGPVDRGYAIRSGLETRAEAEKATIADLYGQIDGTLPIDAAALRQRMDSVTQGLPMNDRLRFRPAEADVPAQLPDQAPVSEAMSIRSGLSSDIRATDNPQQRRIAGQYLDEVDDYIRSALPEDQRALMDQAKTARLDYGRRFEDRGAVPDIIRETGRGQYRMPDEVVAGRVTSGPTDYQAVMREAGSDPAARRAVADQIRDEALQANAIRSPDALARFVRDRNFALQDFPEVRNALERAGTSKQTMEAAQATAKQLERNLAPGGPSAAGQYLKYDDTGTRQAIKTAWNSAQPERAIRDLLDVAGDTPATRAAAKAALWEEVKGVGQLSARTETGEDGVTRWSGRKLQQRLNDPRFARTAEILWEDNPEHLSNVRAAADALAGAEGSLRAKAPGSSGTAQALNGKYDASLSMTSIASRMRSVNRGQLSPTIAIVDVASTALRNRAGKVQAKAIDEMLARAINDPEFAAALLRKHNPADEAAMKRAFLGKFGVRIPTVANILAGDDSDDDDPFAQMMGTAR
ncbi:hypothetical protein E4L95_02705 [Paracoccus liaowanqingii]|uniref:Uncharacterized protein n=1 Tax=Paracoccus liaowanqingii TaxID=2560053 RepID=A0A4Z1CRS1_9RHOB|nr:hypothetical protein [Paracoccus liaowanqingii]TGN68048.1 hypothetical protein E4L95_02705 [Paracoccus liaowanqingii]